MTDNSIRPIIGTLFITTLPNFFKLPLWISVWCMLMWGYVLMAQKYELPFPPKWLCHIMTIIGFLAILVTFRFRSSGMAYIGLLSIMAGLKPFEIRSYRDRMITVFIAYIIIITNLLYSESLLMTIYLFPSVILTTAVLIHINHPYQPIKNKLRLSTKMMLQALPFTLILFFLFPRIQGSIWGMARESTGKSGFSEYLTPGSLSNVVRSGETAFKVEFLGKIPEPDRLYWRGIVFDQFDGKGWTRNRNFITRFTMITGENESEYIVTIEPHHQRWLFALDLPINPPLIARIMSDHSLMAFRNLTQKTRYSVRSFLTYDTGPWQKWESINLELPKSGNQKARHLAIQWKNELQSPELIVDAALTFFKKNNFIYTLNPEPLQGDIIDDFLFRTRKGYCEHYASAFAFLMRVAGIPARVVGGYLGGELNPYGNFLLVRQSDAHAWNEIWLENRGWVRIDPTSVVSPQRVRGGLTESLAEDELPDFLSLKKFGWFSTYWKQIRFAWDAINNQWDIWFMGYSSDQQRTLLSRIGIKDISWKGAIQGVILAIVMISLLGALLIRYHFHKRQPDEDKVLKLYRIFTNKLEKIGLQKKPEQGPLDYANYIISVRKDLESDVTPIIHLYIILRYGKGMDETAFNQFHKLVRSFNPKNKPTIDKEQIQS